MLQNLRNALDTKGITLTAYAAVLGVSQKTLWNKINEEIPFTYPEVKTTMRELLPEYNSDYLFKSDKPDSETERNGVRGRLADGTPFMGFKPPDAL